MNIFKTIKLISIILLAYISTPLFSQQNSLKVGYVDIWKINMSYERVINENQSFQFNFAFLPAKNIPAFIIPDDAKEFNTNSDFSGFSILPEYRFYFSKKDSPRGFYLSTYLKYSKYTGSYTDVFEDAQYIGEGVYTSIGIGGQMGVQWIISDALTIDWYFLGIEMDVNSISLEFTSEADNVNYKKIKDTIEDQYAEISFLGSIKDLSSGDDYVKGKFNYFFPGLRTGFSIGYAF